MCDGCLRHGNQDTLPWPQSHSQELQVLHGSVRVSVSGSITAARHCALLHAIADCVLKL